MEPTSILLEPLSEDQIGPLDKKLEKNLRAAITEQDVEKFRSILNSSTSTRNVNYSDSSGRTLLQVALDIKNVCVRNDIINALLSHGADLQFALLHAVRDNDTKIVEMLLQYHKQSQIEGCIKGHGQEHITPLILAAWLQNFQIVKLLLNRGFTVSHPNNLHLSGDSHEMASEKLGPAVYRLNAYRGLSSPVYIAASFLQNVHTGEDPVYRACVLNKELRDAAEEEYEFRKEYLELSDECKAFAVALLNECRSMEEIRCVMETNNGDKTSGNLEARFNMLELAIGTRNDKFVSHPYSQLLLNAEVHRGVSFLEKSFWKQALLILLASVLSPLLFIVWLVFDGCFPTHKVARMFHAPLVKFLVNCGLYQTFLFLLTFTSSADDFLGYSFNDWLVFWFVIGLLVDVIKDVFHQGRVRFFSTYPNCMAVAVVTLFISHYIIWRSAKEALLRDNVSSLAEFARHPSRRIMLVSEGVLSIGILLAFLNNLSFMQANSCIGPLLQAFIEMLIDVAKFFLYFFFIFMAFAVSFTKLYMEYLSGRKYFSSNQGNVTSDDSVTKSLGQNMAVTFWALFGDIDRGYFQVEEEGFEALTTAGTVIFALFNVAAVLVALNMLIAILNESFTRISEGLDTAWKFTRAKMWLSWIHKRGVLPPPFSVFYVLLPLCWAVKRLASACCPEAVLVSDQIFPFTV